MIASQVFRCVAGQILACLLILIWSIPVQAQETVRLVASGSSLAGNLFASWGAEFARLHPQIRIGYVATSSSDGIRQIGMLRGDFAVGEIPLSDNHASNENKASLAQVPLAVIAIVPVYNLPQRTDMNFTGELLGQIYAGKISNWNDERIAKLNPGASLPNLPIIVLQRPFGTGSRHIFTQFLMKTSREYRRWVKDGDHEPDSEIVVDRSKRMAEKVASTPGAIGFVTWKAAVQHGLTYGMVQNSSERFVKASPASLNAALAAMEELKSKNERGAAVHTRDESYPLTSLLWAYVPATGIPMDRTAHLYEFLDWCLGEGQSLMAGGEYSRLPQAVAGEARVKLHSLLHGQAVDRGSLP